MNEEDDLYKIENYSDTDLFRMLDLTNPTDRELEAKILMEIDKYDNIDESSAKQLKDFFDNVYKHFFEDEESESLYEEGDVIQEGMEGGLELGPGDSTTGEDANNPPSDPTPPGRVVNVEYGRSNLNPVLTETQTRQIQLDSAFRDFENYKTSTDYLINLSETLNHVVSLKLQSVSIPYDWYNVSDNNNANFFQVNGVTGGVKGAYNFKVVVAPGSYDINELVTALDDSIAALALTYPEVNFGTTTVVYNDKTTKLELRLDIQNVFTEIQFYLFFETHANTFDVDVRQTTIPSFLGFSTLVIPDQIALPTPSGVEGTVASVEDTYTINSIYSNFSYMYNATGSSSGTPNSLNIFDEFPVIVEVKDSSGTVTKPGNNYIRFINYEGPGNYVAGTSTILNEVTIYLQGISEDISLTRGTIMESVNRALSVSSSFTANSMLQAYDISYDKRDVPGTDIVTEATNNTFTLNSHGLSNGDIIGFSSLGDAKGAGLAIDTTYYVIESTTNTFEISTSSGGTAVDVTTGGTCIGGPLIPVTMQRFQFIFSFEPAVITYTSNMKQVVIFPDESTFDYPLWTGQRSTFMFDENIVFNQPNSIQGDVSPVSTIYGITSNPIMKVECTKEHYNNSYNNYSITLDNANYTMNEYVGIINYTEQYKNSEINSKLSIASPKTTKQYIDSDMFYDIGSNKVRMSFDILTSFDQTDYELDITGSFLGKTPFSIGSTISITDPTLNVFTTSTSYGTFPFTITSSNNKIVVKPKTLRGNSTVPAYTITFLEGTYTSLRLAAAVNNAFCTIQGENDGANPPVSLNGLNMVQTKLEYDDNGTDYDWTFTYVIVNKMSAQNYKVIFEDTGTAYPDNDGGTGTSWKSYLGFTDTSYNLISSIENNYTSQVIADEDVYVDPNKTITINASNNSFLFSPYSTIKGLYAQDNSSEINIVVPNGTYGVYQLYNELNNIFNLTSETNGTLMYSNFDAGGNESTVLQININKVFSAEDYELVFFDENETELQCNLAKNTPGTSGTTTWDVSIGWLMGFRTYPKYQLSPTNPLNSLYVTSNKYTYNSTTNVITLTGDSCVDMRVYKNLYLIIDDFTQNHLNDGLITGIRKNPNADPSAYSSRATRTCNPITDRNQSSIFNADQPGMGLTENQLYAANVIAEENMLYQTKRIYSDPPYVKDMFGLIPLKLGTLTHGAIITESGGFLQDSTRTYFGPVNITKMNIKLLNDHGEVLDLNGANWSFSLTCEYLYNFNGI